jgi:predicted Zn-dependent peptidase
MNRIGRSELNYGEHRSIERTLAQIEAITLDEVNAVARRLLNRSFGAAVLGPVQSTKTLPPQLQSL